MKIWRSISQGRCRTIGAFDRIEKTMLGISYKFCNMMRLMYVTSGQLLDQLNWLVDYMYQLCKLSMYRFTTKRQAKQAPTECKTPATSSRSTIYIYTMYMRAAKRRIWRYLGRFFSFKIFLSERQSNYFLGIPSKTEKTKKWWNKVRPCTETCDVVCKAN